MAKKLTEYQKFRILAGYEKDIKIETVADVLGVKAATIRSFKSRFLAVYGLPPREKHSKTKISAAIGLALKKIDKKTPDRVKLFKLTGFDVVS